MILLNGHVDDQSFALLVKWFNTLPSQGSIHGFEPRTWYHLDIWVSQFNDYLFFLTVAMIHIIFIIVRIERVQFLITFYSRKDND